MAQEAQFLAAWRALRPEIFLDDQRGGAAVVDGVRGGLHAQLGVESNSDRADLDRAKKAAANWGNRRAG